MPEGEISYSSLTRKAILKEAERLLKEGVVSDWSEALRIAAATLDGTGEDVTVEGIQTCRDIGGKPVSGLTTNDSPRKRTDEFSKSVEERAKKAEKGKDLAEEWLRKNDPEYNKSSQGWGREK